MTHLDIPMVEIAAARMFAAYMSGFDTDDDFANPIVAAMHEYSVGIRRYEDEDAVERAAWDLYLDMINPEYSPND